MLVRRWMLGFAATASAAAIVGSTAGARAADPPDWDLDGAVATDCRPLDPAVHPAATDKPDISFEDLNCDGIDGDPDNAVFVAPTGNDAAVGTRTEPLATVQRAIVMARGTGRDVYVAAGSYARTEIADADDGIEIYGGYTAGSWARGAAATTISGSPYGVSAHRRHRRDPAARAGDVDG